MLPMMLHQPEDQNAQVGRRPTNRFTNHLLVLLPAALAAISVLFAFGLPINAITWAVWAAGLLLTCIAYLRWPWNMLSFLSIAYYVALQIPLERRLHHGRSRWPAGRPDVFNARLREERPQHQTA
jgi:hypothetical protein